MLSGAKLCICTQAFNAVTIHCYDEKDLANVMFFASHILVIGLDILKLIIKS